MTIDYRDDLMSANGYVIVPAGLSEMLGVVTERYGDHAVVLLVPDDHYATGTVSFSVDQLRPATPTEIYEHGEARLKWLPLGPTYGTDAGRTMWALMDESDREYWRSLRPALDDQPTEG